MSLLQPISVKDAIWLDYEVARKNSDDVKYESKRMEYIEKRFEALNDIILDIREINRHTNSFVQLAAIKGAKHAKIEPIKVEDLPSCILHEKREELEKAETEKKKPSTPKKKYTTYAEYLAAEESSEEVKRQKERLCRNAMAFTEHVRRLEYQQGGMESSKGAKMLESEEERLKKIREERARKENNTNSSEVLQ